MHSQDFAKIPDPITQVHPYIQRPSAEFRNYTPAMYILLTLENTYSYAILRRNRSVKPMPTIAVVNFYSETQPALSCGRARLVSCWEIASKPEAMQFLGQHTNRRPISFHKVSKDFREYVLSKKQPPVGCKDYRSLKLLYRD